MNKTRKLSFWKLSSYFSAFLTTALLSVPAFATLGQPEDGAMGMTGAASPMKERMIHFHNDLLMPIITCIAAFVFLLLLIVIIRFNRKANPTPSKTTHNTFLEVVWTLIPVIILAVVSVRSLQMLYYVDKSADTEMTLKVTGNQWFWSYEYPDNGGFNFVSNLVQDKDLKPGQLRLLSTDNPVVLPVDTNIKLLITASDVIHSWAVPAFGIKLDAIPGRLNETWVRIDKEGDYYGQCSQLCGQGHGYMPIEVHAVSKQAFAEWVKKQGGKMPSAAPAAEQKPAEATHTEQKPAAKTKTKKTGDK